MSFRPVQSSAEVAPGEIGVICYDQNFLPVANRVDCNIAGPYGDPDMEFYLDNYCTAGSTSTCHAGVWADPVLVRPSAFATEAAGGGGGSGGGGFEFTAAQQSDVYVALAGIFGALLVAAAAIWAVKQAIRVFAWHGNKDD